MRPGMGFWRAAAVAAILAAPAAAQADDYPNKPVTFVTPAAAGNSPDVVTRLVADKLTQMWKQQVVVINRPGAGGLIAAQAAAALPKDGYSIYMTQASTYTVLPIQQEGKMGVDLQKAFTAVGMVGEQPIAVGVNKDVKANNVAELIKLANDTPGGMLFAATNRGGQSHLTGELFRERSKANISFVHAAGASVSVNDVVAGRIPMMFEGLAGLAPGTQNGGIRLLGVASEKRLPNVPDLPTMSETVPGVVSSGWIVMMVPEGVPDAIVQKLNKDLRVAVADPAVVERMQQLGTYSRDYTPEQTTQFMRNEEKLWWPIVRKVVAEDQKK
ncbi:Bug family tripartite tricarboxylate transporter substrate binding protein [Rhodoplanes sp. Z2-YC6860]|uniref:Bug family tripartite tricarboxylate transporter substrate binding protein n=1 Tax=Rhodoplanes sp. Z2-YC6860 TaxID=674703 RepID=UPI00078B63E1|nr:tripartite tricarboxylate transporter substrate-binding protein [Rhodoplanes sp. Z2-YC6860]AMN44470.1 ABC transporter substrate-binding protein [Rhodoplanes sp. Z2-YC6860]